MPHEITNKLISYYRNNFFTEPILLAVFIFSFVIAIRYNAGEKEIFYFLFYFLVGVLLFLFTPITFFYILSKRNLAILMEIFNTIFELVEFITFYYFFKKCFQRKEIKKISKLFLICLLIVAAVFFTALNFPTYSIEEIRTHSFFINVLEFFFLALLCLAYFYELFTGTPKLDLSKRPSFLITTSTFFYSVLLIPFFIIARDMLRNESSLFFVLFSCHYLLLTIVLLTISKAFLCRKPITT